MKKLIVIGTVFLCIIGSYFVVFGANSHSQNGLQYSSSNSQISQIQNSYRPSSTRTRAS